MNTGWITRRLGRRPAVTPRLYCVLVDDGMDQWLRFTWAVSGPDAASRVTHAEKRAVRIVLVERCPDDVLRRSSR